MQDRDLVEKAKQAAESSDWDLAHSLLAEADALGAIGLPDLPLMAEVAYAAGHLDRAVETWERAHSLAIRARDDLAAAGAAVRVAMHLLFDTALMAPVRGWLSRAERLIVDTETTPVHAWLAVVRSYERMLSGSIPEASRWARAAVAPGTSSGDVAATAIGRVAHARCLILSGSVDDGLTALNEAGVAVLSGELDPLATGVVYCEVVCALQGMAMYDLADEWTHAMERWASTNAIGSLRGRCRVHRAEILRQRGQWRDARREAQTACAELRPYLRRELGWPLAELGQIHLCAGEIDVAEEAFLEAHEVGWDARHGLAMVYLERGEPEQAVQVIRSALEQPMCIPSKELPPNTPLRRAPLLGAAARIEAAAGELARARAAALELAEIAQKLPSKALMASAAESMGHVLLGEGSPDDARRQLEAAVSLWDDIGMPHDAARARSCLAGALRELGKDTLARLEERSAHATLSRLRDDGARADSDATPAQTASTGNRFCRAGEVWQLAFSGEAIQLRDRKGLRHIAQLLSQPDREFHVLALVGLENDASGGSRAPALGDAGPHLDEQAKNAYRRRLEEIEDDLEEATRHNDLGRIGQAHSERDFLVRELSRAVGLGNRDRRASAASERARVSVTRAIRRALRQIQDHHAALFEHLERTIQTGTYCVYRPDPQAHIRWEV